ncbi:MAG: hypothetical protein JW913_10255 [Chitinispirillaceae bacterium]|nr:hypothetical protein [Chitinispirillaceae bacterium]
MIESALPQVERENGLFEVAVDPKKCTASKKEMERLLGYSDNRIDDHFSREIDKVLSGMADRFAVRAGYRLLEVRFDAQRHDGFFVGDRFFVTQRIVAAQMKNAEKAALFACTIGPAMEAWSRRSFRDNDPVTGHFIDTAASDAAEKAAAVLHDHIGLIMAGGGLKITNRFSPGYCGWSVAEQHLLFSFFPENFCGISLTESALMVPVKSVSGMIGIGAKVKRKDYPCDQCGRKECARRAFKKESTSTKGRV